MRKCIKANVRRFEKKPLTRQYRNPPVKPYKGFLLTQKVNITVDYSKNSKNFIHAVRSNHHLIGTPATEERGQAGTRPRNANGGDAEF